MIAQAIVLHALITKKGFEHMANDFSGLTAAIDAVVAGISEVAQAIANPAIDNNDQAVIDSLTAKLNDAATALSAAKAAEDAEDAGVATPTDGSTPPAA